jgi:hypothetical protein
MISLNRADINMEDLPVDRERVITILDGLIEVCRDGERNYRAAALYITEKNPSARFVLQNYALQRAQFAERLQAEMWHMGYVPQSQRQAAACSNGRKLPLPDDQHLLLDECVWRELIAEQRYAGALRAGLPRHLQEIVNNQYIQIREARQRIRSITQTVTPSSS